MACNNEINAPVLARIFSAAVLKELATQGFSPKLARLIRESGLIPDPHSTDPIETVFDKAFKRLKHRTCRHEYVYKVALAQKILLGTHSLNTASLITEFRVGRCKADVVILNGTGTVYEIKSERDSLNRLARQIEAYSRVFATVNVIIGKNHLDNVETSIPDHVGIMVLNRRYCIRTHKEAVTDSGRTDPAAIFDSINQKEASRILKKTGISLPDVPNTQRYAALRELFLTLDSDTAHRRMVECLKHTRNLQPLEVFLDKLPESLSAAIIATPMKKRELDNVVSALNTPICVAVAWG